MTTISELKIGERAKVTGFTDTGRGYRRKLMNMGLMPGAEITIAHSGDPIEIRVRGFSLSLRKEEAAALHVERV